MFTNRVVCLLFFQTTPLSQNREEKKGKTLTNKSLLMDNMKFKSFSINQCLKVKLTVSLHEKTAAVCSTPKYQMKAQKYAGQKPFFKFLHE
jgi:hypothetical protein